MITLESLKGAKLTQTAHINGGGWFGYTHRCIQFPRLSCIDRYVKKDRSSSRTWRVDGEEVADLAAAIEALNKPPILTLEETGALAVIPEDFTCLRQVQALISPNHDVSYRMLYQLAEKGQVEYGRQPGRSDGEPWADSVPEHLRWSPTIRRAKPKEQEHVG